MPLLRPFTSSTAREAGRRSGLSRATAAPREPAPAPSLYSCPPCKDSGNVLVRRYQPEHPEATLSGFILFWEPCPARPCRAETACEDAPGSPISPGPLPYPLPDNDSPKG